MFTRHNESIESNDPESVLGPDWRDWLLLPSDEKREPTWEWRNHHPGRWEYMEYRIIVGNDGRFRSFRAGILIASDETHKAAKLACEDHAEGKGE
jgi:hypothetical protein